MSSNERNFERFRDEFLSESERAISDGNRKKEDSYRLARSLYDQLAPLVRNFPTRSNGNTRYVIDHECNLADAGSSYRIVEKSFVRSRKQVSSGFFGFGRKFDDTEEFWGVTNVVVHAVVGEEINFLFDFGNFDYPNVGVIRQFQKPADAVKAATMLLAMFSVDRVMSAENIKKKFSTEFGDAN